MDLPDAGNDDLDRLLEEEAEWQAAEEADIAAGKENQIDSGNLADLYEEEEEENSGKGQGKPDDVTTASQPEATACVVRGSPPSKRPKLGDLPKTANDVTANRNDDDDVIISDDEDFNACSATNNSIMEKRSAYKPAAIAATRDEEESGSRYRVPQIGERKIYRRRPQDLGSLGYQTVTTSGGERFYLRMRRDLDDEEDNASETDKEKRAANKVHGLCSAPYVTMYQEALREQAKIERAAAATSDALDDVEVHRGKTKEAEDLNNNSASLWVEKFRPRNYMQLLSDDGTNRTLLRWLKLWDKAVFNKDKKPRAPKDNASSVAKEENYKPAPTELIEELDAATGRPVQKVALLHGPPGLGKTTLAHVIAGSTAGYNVVEINASDDRSLAKFKEKFEASTQMRSVTANAAAAASNNAKPNCLIIDEIDGSPAPTINYLVAAITGKATAAGSKKAKKAASILQRPVICICNDLYVPALRPLKQHALIVPFPPTLSSRLVQRLQEIAGIERMKADQTALMALAEKTENDIRSCLSTLQFFKSRGKALKAIDVHQTFVGQKDAHKSHFSVWKELFTIPRTSSKRKYVGGGGDGSDLKEESMSSLPARFNNMLRTAQSCVGGDYERIMQGLFENYLHVKFKDIALQNVTLGCDWFSFFDTNQQYINSSQNYSTAGYLPYVFVASHLLFAAAASSGGWKLKYPSTHYEKNNAAQKSRHTLDALISEMTPASRIFASPSTLVSDVLPHLLEISQPNLRPVNVQLYSAREKQDLKQLVQILIAYNLTFVQERTSEGQYTYRLDPPVEEVAHFPDINHRSLPYAIKQMIAHEVEVEKMRREDESRRGPTPTGNHPLAATSSSTDQKTAAENGPPNQPAGAGSGSAAAPSNHWNQKLQPKKAGLPEKEHVPTDFFGRVIQAKSGSGPNGGATGNAKENGGGAGQKTNLLSNDIWFKFKEGYNNAVRRTVRLQDLA